MTIKVSTTDMHMLFFDSTTRSGMGCSQASISKAFLSCNALTHLLVHSLTNSLTHSHGNDSDPTVTVYQKKYTIITITSNVVRNTSREVYLEASMTHLFHWSL